jgi:hypothetical protein
VCSLDTTYKMLSAIITDRLYRLAERHGFKLLNSSQEGFRQLHSMQRQVQSLHWTIQEAAALSRGQRQGDWSSPLFFGLVFNALLLPSWPSVSGLRAPARGFAA